MALILWEDPGKKQNQLKTIKLNKMAKLKKEELKSLKQAIEKVTNMQAEIGGIEIQKHQLLHAVSNANMELQAVQKQLEDKYGKVSVDITTGKIKDPEPCDGCEEKCDDCDEPS